MNPIRIELTNRTPEINFDFTANTFAIRGESYPEDVPAFYGPLLTALKEHLRAMEAGSVEFNFELIYFNSTSAKVVMKLFDLLEATAEQGVTVTINWHFKADDLDMGELGEEFGEDLENATFKLCPQP